jgi:YesN/AraC family two-component response regulator
MNDHTVNILWIELCRNKKNEQRIDTLHKKIITSKIYPADKNQISHAIAIIKPNLICIDYDFPDLLGLKLLRQIRSGHSNIPVVMLTIQHSEKLAVWAFRTGVRNYLIKPLQVNSIIEEISQLATQFKPKATRPRINLLKRYSIPKEFQFIPSSLLSQRTIPAVNYVEAHYQEKITEKEVATVCGMSIFTFSRIFRNEHHITFREFLIKHRIMQAKEFLKIPEIAITEVAQLSGFSDTSSFSRFFRRYIGITPSYYQKKRIG